MPVFPRLFPAVVAAAFAVGAPAFAHGGQHGPAPQDDRNSYWLDYRTDISEAKRELESDLRRANDDGDVADAWAEYRAELADARKDYRKEMIERGYTVGRVTVEDAN